MFASSAAPTLTQPLGAIVGRGFVGAGVGWGGGFVGGCLCPGLPDAMKPAVPTLREGRRRYLPTLERRIDLIAPDLRRTVRQLLTGEVPWPLFLYGAPGVGKTRAVLELAGCDRRLG